MGRGREDRSGRSQINHELIIVEVGEGFIEVHYTILYAFVPVEIFHNSFEYKQL